MWRFLRALLKACGDASVHDMSIIKEKMLGRPHFPGVLSRELIMTVISVIEERSMNIAVVQQRRSVSLWRNNEWKEARLLCCSGAYMVGSEMVISVEVEKLFE